MTQWVTKPANQILIAGDPTYLEVEIGANATAAKMLPGRIVIHDTDDGDVKEAGANAVNPLGVLDVQAGELEETAYAVGDQARLITGPGCHVKLLLKGGENVAVGDQLVCAADGKVAKQGTATAMVVAQALESSNVTGDAEIAAKLLI